MNSLANFEKKVNTSSAKKMVGRRRRRKKFVFKTVVWWLQKELPSHLKLARRLRWSLQKMFNLKLAGFRRGTRTWDLMSGFAYLPVQNDVTTKTVSNNNYIFVTPMHLISHQSTSAHWQMKKNRKQSGFACTLQCPYLNDHLCKLKINIWVGDALFKSIISEISSHPHVCGQASSLL